MNFLNWFLKTYSYLKTILFNLLKGTRCNPEESNSEEGFPKPKPLSFIDVSDQSDNKPNSFVTYPVWDERVVNSLKDGSKWVVVEFPSFGFIYQRDVHSFIDEDWGDKDTFETDLQYILANLEGAYYKIEAYYYIEFVFANYSIMFSDLYRSTDFTPHVYYKHVTNVGYMPGGAFCVNLMVNNTEDRNISITQDFISFVCKSISKFASEPKWKDFVTVRLALPTLVSFTKISESEYMEFVSKKKDN